MASASATMSLSDALARSARSSVSSSAASSSASTARASSRGVVSASSGVSSASCSSAASASSAGVSGIDSSTELCSSSARSSAGVSSSRSRPGSSGGRVVMSVEEEQDELRREVVVPEDERRHEDHRDEHDDRGVDDLVAGGPRDLLQLAPDLAEVLAGAGALALRRRLRAGLALGRARPVGLLTLHQSLGLSVHVTASLAGDLTVARSGFGVTRRGSRAGGTRTPNRRFWRPVLCQIELLPSGRAGARTPRVAAAFGRTSAGSGYATAARRRERARISAAAVPAVASAAPPMAPAYASRRPDSSDRTAWRSPASSRAARVWASRLGDGSRKRVRSCWSARSIRRYRASSAWHRRHDSMCFCIVRSTGVPSTVSGSIRATSSHRMGGPPAFLEQHVAEALPPPVQPHLRRRHRDAEVLGDGLVRQAVHVLEHHGAPQLLGQRRPDGRPPPSALRLGPWPFRPLTHASGYEPPATGSLCEACGGGPSGSTSSSRYGRDRWSGSS